MKHSILSFLSLIIVSPLLAKDWPQYHGLNSNRTTDEVIQNTDWESKKPKKLWTLDFFSKIRENTENFHTDNIHQNYHTDKGILDKFRKIKFSRHFNMHL